MKDKGLYHVHPGPAVVCSWSSFMDSDRGLRTDCTREGASWEHYIAVIPPGFLMTDRKFDRIFSEYRHKGKPLSEDEVNSLFNKHDDYQ